MQWLTWIRRLQTIFQAGLTYAKDPFDRERYEQLRQLTAEMAAAHAQGSPTSFDAIFAAEAGYATPKVDVRAVILQNGEILLVKERDEDAWSLPGGWADIGSTPSEMAEREAREETGLEVRATRLLAVFDKARHEHPPQLWYVYKLFFLCEITGGALDVTGHEIASAAFFPRAALPENLSLHRVTRAQILRMFDLAEAPGAPAAFD